MKDSFQITHLLERARDGNLEARDELLRTSYEKLRRLAQDHLRRQRRDPLLCTTMLVNEVAAELLEGEMLPGRNHHQFFAYVSKAMRHVLVDHARSRGRLKRGGGFARLELTDALVVCEEQPAELLALNVALEKLAENDQRKARVVELRYFGGFSVDEAAEVLGISPATVKRDWEIARTWLFRELTRGDSCVD